MNAYQRMQPKLFRTNYSQTFEWVLAGGFAEKSRNIYHSTISNGLNKSPLTQLICHFYCRVIKIPFPSLFCLLPWSILLSFRVTKCLFQKIKIIYFNLWKVHLDFIGFGFYWIRISHYLPNFKILPSQAFTEIAINLRMDERLRKHYHLDNPTVYFLPPFWVPESHRLLMQPTSGASVVLTCPFLWINLQITMWDKTYWRVWTEKGAPSVSTRLLMCE